MADEEKDRYVIAIDVGGTGLKGAIINRQGNILVQENRLTRRERGSEAVTTSVLDFASDLVKKAREALGAHSVVAAGVAVPGVVDESKGLVVAAVNLGWKDLSLRTLLEDRLGVQVIVGHDVRTASLAEGIMGAAQGSEDYLFLTLGTGVGAAVVLHGSLYIGVHGAGGEFGHMVVQPDGPLCLCGRRGCIETLASASAVVRRYRAMAQESEDITTVDVAKRAVEGDRVAEQVWSEAIEALSIGIANYVHLLDPERIVIGGGMADAGQILFDPLIAGLARQVTLEPVPPPVLPAALGNDAGYLGAALKAWLALGVSRTALKWRNSDSTKVKNLQGEVGDNAGQY